MNYLYPLLIYLKKHYCGINKEIDNNAQLL